MEDVSRTRLTSDSAWSVTAAVINAAVAFVCLIIVGNVWGDAGLGRFALSMSLYCVASTVFGLGVPMAALYEVSSSLDNAARAARYVMTAVVMSACLGIVGGGAVLALSGTAAALFDEPGVGRMLGPLGCAIPLFLVNKTCMAVLNAHRRMRLIACAHAARSAILVAALVMAATGGGDLVGVAYGVVVGELAIGVLLAGVCFAAHRPVRPSLASAKTMLGFGWKMSLSGSLADLNYRLDILVVGLFCGAGVAGVYSVAAAVAKGFWIIPDAVMRVSNPLITQLYRDGDIGRLHRVVDVLFRWGISGFMAVGLVCGVLAVPLVALAFPLRPEMRDVAPLLYWLLPGAVMYAGVAAIASAPAASIGRPHNELKRISCMLMLNAGLTLLLVPRFGAVGAAAATTVATLTAGVAYFVFLLRRELDQRVPVAGACGALLMFALLMVLVSLSSGALSPPITIAVGLVVLGGTLWHCGLFRGDDWALMFAMIFRTRPGMGVAGSARGARQGA